MTQQEKLNERVEAAVAALPYALNEDQKSRLQIEMDTINDYHRAEMLNTAVEISDAALAEGEHIELWSRDGYCVSFVCWQIGISDFNPFDHPELITIDYALNNFRTKSSINIYMNYTSPGENVLGRLFGKKYYSRNTATVQVLSQWMTFSPIPMESSSTAVSRTICTRYSRTSAQMSWKSFFRCL